MLNLTQEQIERLQQAIQEKAKEGAEKAVKELDITLDHVVDKLAPLGWTLPAELNIYAINVIGQTDEIADLNKFLYEYFCQDQYAVMKTMISHIQNSSIKSGLKKMVNECWTSFQNKLYAVCSTAILSVIEGILSEFSDDKQDIRMMKVCQKQVDTFPENGSTIKKHIWISYNKFIRNLYMKSDFNSEEPSEINRHWLLHGRSDFEIDELDCIRLFNAVSSLCTIYNHETKES